MAQQDLSYVFQPVLHEPLSRPDVTSLQECSIPNPNMEGTYTNMGMEKPLSPDSVAEEEKEALANIAEADKHKIDHPRKAMSLYLKAGKALVLCNEADAALKCFRCLILLATDQLTKVAKDKQKLTKVRRSETSVNGDTSKKDKKKVNRTKSFDIPNREGTKSPRMSPRNYNSVSEASFDDNDEILTQTSEQTAEVCHETVQENNCEFFAVEEIQSTMENEEHVVIINVDNQEMTMPEEVALCEAVTEIGPSCLQDEMPVFSVTEVTNVGESNEITVSCVTTDNVCEVNCFETEACLDFEVAMVESLDDSASTHSSVSTEDIIKTVNAEIVMMDCSDAALVSTEEVPADPKQSAHIRRGYVVSELIDTEQNYIRDLGDVIKGYMASLSKESNVPNEIKGKEKVIFSNIQDIHEWHSSTFFDKLKVCDDDPSILGQVFSSSESKLEELYTIYCRSKQKSDLLVLPYKDTFFKECRKRCGQRLQLPDYLIKPVQRITKYQLLLRDILKFTERAGEDGSEIQKAMDVALRILKRTNDMIAVATIQGYDAKPDDTGELLLRETLEIAEGKYRQKVKERTVFLFERLMVVTEPIEKEGGVTELRYQSTIKTHGVGITETVDSDPCKWAIWLRKRGSSEIYVLKAPSPEVKDIWIKHIKQCSQKKKAPGLLKSLYRSRTFKREESETKEILDSLSPTLDDEDAPKFSASRKSSKRKPSKMITRKKKSRESGISDRLKENILKFRAEEQMISVEEAAEVTYDEPPNSLTNLSPESALPQSPEPVDTNVSFIEQRAKIEAEENQLNKVLMLTRLIAARLLQTKDATESLGFYSDVIASLLPINELRRRQETFAARDSLLENCTEIYENWRTENLFESSDIEEHYTSMTSLLSETAGFCSVHKGNPWSVVLYSVCAVAGGREQKWRDASQAFYRLSLVYSALQETSCAVDSLVDAHWMSCQAGDYQGAVNFFYNAFIRALACRDLMRCLRFEQQGVFLMERMTPKDGNNNCNDEVTDDHESRGLVSAQHLSFLISMSRATRRRDWAWFEFAESELGLITNSSSGRQANAILSAVFHKLKRLMSESTA